MALKAIPVTLAGIWIGIQAMTNLFILRTAAHHGLIALRANLLLAAIGLLVILATASLVLVAHHGCRSVLAICAHPVRHYWLMTLGTYLIFAVFHPVSRV